MFALTTLLRNMPFQQSRDPRCSPLLSLFIRHLMDRATVSSSLGITLFLKNFEMFPETKFCNWLTQERYVGTSKLSTFNANVSSDFHCSYEHYFTVFCSKLTLSLSLFLISKASAVKVFLQSLLLNSMLLQLQHRWGQLHAAPRFVGDFQEDTASRLTCRGHHADDNGWRSAGALDHHSHQNSYHQPRNRIREHWIVFKNVPCCFTYQNIFSVRGVQGEVNRN